MEKISCLDTAKNISDKIINDLFPEEMSHFQIFWRIFKDYLNKWRDIDPDEWPIQLSYQKLSKDIALANISEIISLNGPKIALIISAVLVKIAEKYDFSINKENKELMSIIEKYGNRFRASPPLIKHLQNRIPELVDLKNIEDLREERKVEESKPRAIRKEAYARMWTLRTDDPENGDIISKQEYDEILKNKDNTALIIIKTNGFKNLYVYGNDKDLSQLRYDLLEYVLKHRGCGGDVLNLLENVWKSKALAEDLKKELKKAKKAGNEKSIKIEIYAKTGHIRKAVSELNSFFKEKINVDLKTLQKGQYKLTRPLDYYLVEIFYLENSRIA